MADTQSVTPASLNHARVSLTPDGETLRRTLSRFAVLAGLATIGWLLTALVGASSAAASTSDGDSSSGGGLLGAVGGLATNTLGTVTDTVSTVTTTVTNTVDTTVDTVTTTVSNTVGTLKDTTDSLNNVVQPIVGGDEPADTTQPSAPAADTVSEPVTATSQPARTTERSEPAQRVQSDSAPAERPSAPQQQTTAPDTHTSAADGPGGQQRAPFAPPTPCAPAAGVVLAHASADHGGATKHQLASLDSRATSTQLKLIGSNHSRPVFGAGRDAALPCTTPD